MFTKVTTERVAEIANRVGKEVARQYPGIEAEDIAGEVVTALCEKIETVKDEGEDYLYAVLTRDASAYAAKERYDYILYSSQYVYTPKEIRAILEHVYYDESARDVPTQRDDWLSADIGKGVVGISVFDVDEAMDRIRPDYRKLLERRYRYGDEIRDTKAVTRAIDELTRSVNRLMFRKGYSEEGPGSRRVVSNNEARHITTAESSFETPEAPDALVELQRERLRERPDPAGTHFNWSKHDN